MKAREDEHEAIALALRKAEQPVLDDLAKSLGITIDTIWDLHSLPESNAKAIPVLLRHLVRDYPDGLLEAIGHCVADKSARPWWEELKSLYLEPQREVVRDRLAAALSSCAKREHYDDLLAFTADRALGESRVYFLRPINRIGNRISPGLGRSAVEHSAQDPELEREASAILKGRGPRDG